MRKRPFTTCYVFVCALKYAFVFSHEMFVNMLIYYVLCVFLCPEICLHRYLPIKFLSICQVFVYMSCVCQYVMGLSICCVFLCALRFVFLGICP